MNDIQPNPDSTDSRPPRLEDQICFALYAASNAIVRAYRPKLDAFGLTYPQYLVLLTLWHDGPLRMREVADRLQLPRNAITPIIDRLAEAGHVRRERVPGDRRATLVTVTEAAKVLEPKIAEVQRAVAQETALDPEALGHLREELRVLAEKLGPEAAFKDGAGDR